MDGDGADVVQDGVGRAGLEGTARGRDGERPGAGRAADVQNAAFDHAAVCAVGHVTGQVGRLIVRVGRLGSQRDARAGQDVRPREGIEMEPLRLARRGGRAGEEDEVRAAAQLAVRRAVDGRASGIARIDDARRCGAAAVEVDGGHAAELGHPFGQQRERQAGGNIRFVDGVENQRTVGLESCRGTRAEFLCGVELEVRRGDAVFDEHLAAAAGVLHGAPRRVAGRRDLDDVAGLQGLHGVERAGIAAVLGDGKDEAVLQNVARGRLVLNGADGRRECAGHRQLRLAAQRLEDDVVGFQAALRRGVIVAGIESDAVVARQGLVVEDFLLRAADRRRDLQLRRTDDGFAVGKEADGADVSARTEDALRDDEAVGDAVVHVEERAVHARDEHEILIFEELRRVVHRAAAIDDHRPHRAARRIGQGVLL